MSVFCIKFFDPLPERLILVSPFKQDLIFFVLGKISVYLLDDEFLQYDTKEGYKSCMSLLALVFFLRGKTPGSKLVYKLRGTSF